MVKRLKFFRPRLAGATLKDRVFACIGALAGIAATGVLARLALGDNPMTALLLAAPMGASAVLLFAVPASPLAQPWPIIGGNTVSALLGVTMAWVIPDPMIAGAFAVALAIAFMSMLRCLHPPGGAVALTAVIGGHAVEAQGFVYALSPVLIDSLILVAAGWLFHHLSGHSYPHRPIPAPAHPPAPLALTSADIDAALDAIGEPLDITREDLDVLIEVATAKAVERVAKAV